jgi:hypothetical protein
MSDADAAGESEALLPAKDKQDGVANLGKETQTGGAEAYKTAIRGEFNHMYRPGRPCR